MITVGGSSFTPGSPETLAVSGLDTSQASAVFRYSTLSVSGSLSGSVWSFAFTADDTGVFDPTPNRFDCQIVYADNSITPVVLRTGERKNGTEPTVPPGTTRVAQVTAGTGLTATPNPIISKGSIALNATISNLTDVTTSSVGADDFLSWSGSAWVNRAMPFMPEPGTSNRVRVGKVWNPLLGTPALVDVYRESFYQALNSSGPTGDVELKASGVSFIVGCGGYVWNNGNNRITSMPFDSDVNSAGIGVNASTGAMTIYRGSFVDDADDGYFCWVDYVDA